ncbi:MAG TPA: Rrf2 family transcriptional regulator [Acidobacteriota bacterium]|nr:Rrf2 family transcriptional regulator [Acidobacteriota bacterium]
MLFSRSAEYGIRAMTFLATLPPGRLAGAREISEAERIPMAFLWKILQNLAKRKLIRSFKGQRGGYELAQPADHLTLRMILEATDSADRIGNCVLGLPNCSDENACPLHEAWKELRGNMTAMLHRNTLADLARVAGRRNGGVAAE